MRGGSSPCVQREEQPNFHSSLGLSAFTDPWEWPGGDFGPVHLEAATKH